VIVYGDRERPAPAQEALAGLLQHLAEARAASSVLTRRARLAALAIDTGALAQALQDRAYAQSGQDELSELVCVANLACAATGRAFVAVHRARTVDWPEVEQALRALSALTPGCALRLRDPEGYAFYALYPELYVEAAAALGAQEVQVIGIRSIGCSLAGLVAAALETKHAVLTVRPVGHPFSRELRLGPGLEAALLRDADRRTYAVVDEGPGLSGSSFDAVSRYLRERGVAPDRIVFFPSHAGEPGAQASDGARARYQETRRLVQTYEQYFDDSTPARSPASWFADEIGSPIAPVRDLSAGRWRALHYPEPTLYPPSYARDERRKYLVETGSGWWLLKYAGLGGSVPQIEARARMLSEAGLTPVRVGTCHGYALTRFERDALPLARAGLDRAQLVAHVARYLAFLAARFPVAPGRGASPTQLLALARQNASELWGEQRAATLAQLEPKLAQWSDAARPCAIDGKLDLCEWLLTRDGRLLKCDADDHHAGHDCIGCQDPAWDVAGATLELGLNEAERERVCAALFDAVGLRLPADKLRFYELAYAAFRAGRAEFGEQSLRGWADQDAQRLAAERVRYAHEVALRLDG
jgi:hypothetical protein